MVGLVIVVAVLCITWVLFYGLATWSVLHIDVFETEPIDEREEWPRLSVIAPACNEADTIRAAVESLCQQDYLDYEVVVIDDRSTDGTTEIVDQLAGSNERIVAVHVDELPDGWLGKVNAMNVGLEYATGELLLFTDADVHFAPDALRRAVSVLRRRHLDHLTILPSIGSTNVMLEAVMSAFGALLLATSRPHKMEDPDSDATLGVGAFNLVRREFYDQTPGLEWLRMDIIDDSALARLLSIHGANQTILISRTDVDVEWYTSIPGMVRGLEKNLFAVACNYSVPRAAVGSIGILVFVLAPFVALASPGGVAGFALFSVAIGSMLVSNLIISRRMGRGYRQILLLPLAQLIILVALLRSSILTVRNDGVTWRGTHYSLAELRTMQRYGVS